jgi:large subunit ribosomal protein L9
MELILIEGVQNLGNAGDLVKVKNGYGRNFLIPQQKALRATEQNKREFEAKRAEIEKANAAKKKDAEKESAKLEGKFFVLIRQAGEDGRLYGSVSARDIAASASESTGVEVKRGQILQFAPIKNLGVYPIKVELHADVTVGIYVNVSRSVSEAEIAQKTFQNPATKKAEGEEVAAEVAAPVEGEATPKKKKKKNSDKIIDIKIEDEEEPAAE